jgi:hypothetical protein
VPTIPNGVIRVKHGSWNLIANLSAFQVANPVAQPDDEDFEPDGTWYSMTSAGGALYPMDSNHGELDKVTTSGHISRVVDISAQVGHVVPTAILPLGPKGVHHGKGHKSHKHPGRFVIANLGVFGPPDGTTPNESVWTINAMGHLTRRPRLEQVLGLPSRPHARARDEHDPGGPTPGTARSSRSARAGRSRRSSPGSSSRPATVGKTAPSSPSRASASVLATAASCGSRRTEHLAPPGRPLVAGPVGPLVPR